MTGAKTTLRLRVIYGDTDAMGVVYYANHLRWFEAARGELLRALGMSYGDVERRGLAFPVVDVRCAYRAPARYEDEVDVAVEIAELGRASFTCAYRITRGGTLLAEGRTAHACTEPGGRPVRLPDDIRALLAGKR
ncbi:MAG: thioesterase family protein [Myxococcota bacterium]